MNWLVRGHQERITISHLSICLQVDRFCGFDSYLQSLIFLSPRFLDCFSLRELISS